MKEPYQIGDEFTVDFMLNKKGGKPICRIDGIVCFIDNKVRDFVTPSSTWVVAITGIQENCMVVRPLMKVRTPKENVALVSQKITELQKQKTIKVRTPKLKKGYQYKSFVELKTKSQ